MRRQMAQFLQQYLQALLEQERDEEEEEIEVEEDDDDEDDDYENMEEDDVEESSTTSRVRPTRQVSKEEQMMEYERSMKAKKDDLQSNDIVKMIQRRSNLSHPKATPCNFVTQLNRRRARHDSFTRAEKINITQTLLPNYNNGSIDSYDHQVFCGQFSPDGQIFMSACQDQIIRLYRYDHIKHATERGKRAKPFKSIHARDVGWSVIGVDYSPDRKFIIYSSWSPYVHLAAVDTTSDYHEGLDMNPGSHRFCAFSVKFSPDSREILAGASDNCVYLYDLPTKTRVLRINAHENDVNTVCWADDSSQIFYSGSDDTYCKVWDRRLVTNSRSKPVGVLVGHAQGVTCVSTKGDARYFISNGKDQALKLWDLRMMKTYADDNIPKVTDRYTWDYRFQQMSSRYTHRISKHDTSLMTYTGHRVLQTLIKCYFSPMETTGQRYIYTGSHDGVVYVYDILTGETVHKLIGHSGLIRDVSWHPQSNDLLSSSWDGSVLHWSYRPDDSVNSDDEDDPMQHRESVYLDDMYDDSEDDDDEYIDESLTGDNE